MTVWGEVGEGRALFFKLVGSLSAFYKNSFKSKMC